MYSKIILFILLPIFAFSQAPQKINFQSILRNTNGEVVANKSVSLKISILSGSIGGSAAYSETHTKTTDPSGLISLQIGAGTVLSGVFANIGWGDFPHFIKLEADFSGGNNFVLLGTQELMSVPYALYASKTDTSSLNLVNRFNSKVNVSDTSNMLSNYRTGLNNKVNISDTTSMLNPYLRKSDSIITDLQNQDKLLQSFSNVVDIDGNSYKTVKIGSQVWMSKNLKTSRYRNGDVIPVVTDNTAWSGLTTGARSWYNNDSTLYEYPYGNLYNWYAASDNRNICPTGWHMPSDGEYETLFNYLGGRSVAGGKMISTSSYWSVSQIKVATNESGFSALPGGYRYKSGNFYNIGGTAFFWSASEYYFNRAWFYYLAISSSNLNIDIVDRSHGYSVRCLRDPDIDINQSLNIKVNIADTSDMLNPYLRKADAIVSVETDPVFNSSVAKGITGIDTAYWNRKTGNTAGSIQYWNGNSWVNLTPGRNGQTLQLINGLPSWSGPDYASLTTSIASFITINSAVVGGNISSDGGASISSRGIVYGTLPNPTLTNTVLNLGSGTGIFSGPLIGLIPNTTFYFRSYATNITGTVYGNEVTFTTLQGVTDIEGNTYNTIQIGSQLWMMENLKTTKYRGGESIPNVVADLDWQSLTTGAWVHYDHGFTYNAVYGKLYNWYSTKGDSICPINWHVPTDLDWILLFNNLNGNSVAGGKMKSVGTSYWNSPNIGATNESGFSGLPGGFRDNYGFQDFGDSTAFWSSTESDTNHAFIIALDSYSKAGIGPNNRLKTVGNSIRCLKN